MALLMMVSQFLLSGCGGGGGNDEAAVYTVSKPADREGLSLANGSRSAIGVVVEGLAFEVPAHWQRLEDPGDFTLAAWRFRDEAGQIGVLRVSRLGGDQVSGQALLMNVNRWRGQLGLAPQPSAAGLLGPPVATANGSVRVLDMRSPIDVADQPSRFRIAVLTEADARGMVTGTYFLKLEGGHSTVEGTRPALDALLASLRLRGPIPMPAPDGDVTEGGTR